jgi:hypothetical protein
MAAKEVIVLNAKGTADWRRRTALIYPDDVRHLHAAKHLESLATALNALSEDHPLFSELDRLMPCDHQLHHCAQIESRMLRLIGFWVNCDNAEVFLAHLIRELAAEAKEAAKRELLGTH